MNKVNKLHQSNHELIISRVDNGFRSGYILSWMFLILGGIFLFSFSSGLSAILFTLAFVFTLKYGYYLRFPANFWPVTIRVEGNSVYVNKKVLALEDLLFLSFHETENYRIIRLEARRKSMLFPKEARLLSNCSCLEEAIQVCREIRDFIDPSLKINHVRLVSGKSEDIGQGSRSIKFEHWEFLR